MNFSILNKFCILFSSKVNRERDIARIKKYCVEILMRTFQFYPRYVFICITVILTLFYLVKTVSQ